MGGILWKFALPRLCWLLCTWVTKRSNITTFVFCIHAGHTPMKASPVFNVMAHSSEIKFKSCFSLCNECVPIKAPISAADTGRLSTINSPSFSPIKPCMSPRHNTPTSKISVPMYYYTVTNKNMTHSMHVLPPFFLLFRRKCQSIWLCL